MSKYFFSTDQKMCGYTHSCVGYWDLLKVIYDLTFTLYNISHIYPKNKYKFWIRFRFVNVT